MVIRGIFEELRSSFSDYTKLDDPKYLEFSPYENDETFDTAIIEFNIDEEIPFAESKELVSLPTLETKTGVAESKAGSLTSFFNRRKLKGHEVVESLKATGNKAIKSEKWVLFDKDRLGSVVNDFQRQTQKLKDYMILVQSAQLSRLLNKTYRDAIGSAINSQDAERLGLVPHARLIELNRDYGVDTGDYSIANSTITLAPETHELTSGTLSNWSVQPDPDPEYVLVELKHYPPSQDTCEGPDSDTVSNVQQLASLLAIAPSVLRTLPFRGFINQPKEKRYAFVYQYPENVTRSLPISLQDLILSRNTQSRFSLKTRFDVAQKLAQSIGLFHADRWVHKSVSSQSVVFFQDLKKRSLKVDSPYLVDFGYSRPEGGLTYVNLRSTTPEMSVYLHPDRPKQTFTKLHDIYALGIVLLELATWTSAQARFETALEGLDLKTASVKPESMMTKFIEIAETSIPYYMGASYAEAVIACLNDSFKGQTGGARFPQTFQREIVDKLSAENLLG